MRISLARKEDLCSSQLEAISARLEHSERLEGHCGPAGAWRAYQRYLYAFLECGSGLPIGIAEASGRPVSAPGWWIDPDFRGQGYGCELVDLLAAHLRGDGVTHIGKISIQTPRGTYDTQSANLVKRLRMYFTAPMPNPSFQRPASPPLN